MLCALKLPLSYLVYATSPVTTQQAAVKHKASVTIDTRGHYVPTILISITLFADYLSRAKCPPVLYVLPNIHQLNNHQPPSHFFFINCKEHNSHHYFYTYRNYRIQMILENSSTECQTNELWCVVCVCVCRVVGNGFWKAMGKYLCKETRIILKS